MRVHSVIFCTIFVCGLLASVSCNKLQGALKNVEGKVAGQVLNKAGHGRGYVSVELAPEGGTGKSYTTLAEDSGNFMIDTVQPGTYKMHVKISGGEELPSDTPTVKVGPGRTITQNIILEDQPAS